MTNFFSKRFTAIFGAALCWGGQMACGAVQDPLNQIDFENWPEGLNVGPGYSEVSGKYRGATTDSSQCYFCYAAAEGGSENASVIRTQTAGPEIKNASGEDVEMPYPWTGLENTAYLEFSTGYGILWRTFNAVNDDWQVDTEAGGYSVDEKDGVYIDSLVQFTPVTASTASGGADSDDKLTVWVQEMTSGGKVTGTNLCCMAQYWDWSEAAGVLVYSNAVFTLKPQTGTLAFTPDTWYRLTVKAVRNVFQADELGLISAFRIFVNGTPFVTEKPCFGSAFQSFCRSEELSRDETLSAMAANQLVGSLEEMRIDFGDTQVFAMGMEGEGAVDNIELTVQKPTFDGGTLDYLDFTLAWDGHVTALTYTCYRGALRVGWGTSLTGLSGGGSCAISRKLFSGNRVEVTDVVYADGYSAGTWTTSGSVTLADNTAFEVQATGGSGTVTGQEHALGGSGTEADPYIVASYADLACLRAHLGDTHGKSGQYYRQTADIALNDNVSWTPIGSASGVAFAGLYLGQGHRVTGLRLGTSADWTGFFGAVDGATVQDLVLADAEGTELEKGALVCGRASGKTSFTRVMASGTVNGTVVAGLLGTAAANADVTFTACTNNAGVSARGDNVRAGGFVAQVDQAESRVKVERSVNRRMVQGTGSSSAWVGGLVGWIGADANEVRLTASTNRGEVAAQSLNPRPNRVDAARAGGFIGSNDKGAESVRCESLVSLADVTVTCAELPEWAGYGGAGGLLGYGALDVVGAFVDPAVEIVASVTSNASLYAVGAFVGWNDGFTVTGSGTLIGPAAYTAAGAAYVGVQNGFAAAVVAGGTSTWSTVDTAFRTVAPSGTVYVTERAMTLTDTVTADGLLMPPTLSNVEFTPEQIRDWIAPGCEVAASGDNWVVRESPPAVVDFILALGDGVSAVRYVIGGETNLYTSPFEAQPDVPVELVPEYGDWRADGYVTNLTAAAASGLVVTPNGTGNVRATVAAGYLDAGAVVKAGAAPADLGIAEGPFAALEAGASELSNLVAWAENWGVSVAQVNAMGSGETAAEEDLAAYLLNVDPARVDLSGATNYRFGITAFDGTTLVMGAQDTEGVAIDLGNVNGHWGLSESTDLKTWTTKPATARDDPSDPAWQDFTTGTGPFFRALLSVTPVTE